MRSFDLVQQVWTEERWAREGRRAASIVKVEAQPTCLVITGSTDTRVAVASTIAAARWCRSIAVQARDAAAHVVGLTAETHRILTGKITALREIDSRMTFVRRRWHVAGEVKVARSGRTVRLLGRILRKIEWGHTWI